MRTYFFEFFKRKKEGGVGIDITRHVGDINFRILSDRIELSACEIDAIINIISSELKTVTNQTGYIISRRIVEEVNPSKVCTAKVDGGENGKDWLIQLSNNPLEFID